MMNKLMLLLVAVIVSGCETTSFTEVKQNAYKNEMTLEQKRTVSAMSVERIRYLADSVLCEASMQESGYVPNPAIFREIEKRGLVCQIFGGKKEYAISDRELCMQYMTLPSMNFYHGAREKAIRERGIDCWKYGNVAEERRKADADFQRSLQPQQRTVPQQIIIQQPNNPNACIQDGGGVYCPNHPNTRQSQPIFR